MQIPLKNACPVCRNVNALDATTCRYCATALTPPPPPVAAGTITQRRRWPLAVGGIAVALMAVLGGYGLLVQNQVEATTALTQTVGTDEGAALKFDPLTFTVAANQALQIIFVNKSTLPHNLAFEDAAIPEKTAAQVAANGGSETITITTPGPGTYRYVCTIHPGMVGDMIVEGPQ